MANNFVTPTPPVGVGVFIATPTFQAPVTAYTWSLARTTAELTRRGIPWQLGIPDDVKNVDDGRNDLVRQFLQGNCTDLLFIDSDMRWEPDAVIRLLSWNEDVVCGAYRFKSDSGTYPIGRILHADEKTGLLDVSYAPTGFMRIRRRVFEELADSQFKSGGTAFYFMRKFNENTYDGGDVNFCRKWIRAGGKVKIDPSLFFEHVGHYRWGGRFSDYLKKEENLARHLDNTTDKNTTAVADAPPVSANPASEAIPDVPAAQQSNSVLDASIRRLMDGDDGISTFEALADAYGNKPWALSAEGLDTIWRLATNLTAGQTILECGSGISTVVLAIAAKKIKAQVIALEQNSEWAEKTDAILAQHGLEASILVRPIVNGWYNPEGLEKVRANLVVIDGPVRKDGIDRLAPFKRNIGVSPTAAAFLDDANVAQLRQIEGGWFDYESGPKPMVVGRLGAEAKNAEWREGWA